MIRYYDKIPDMECLTGDASPVFNIEVETEYDLSSCTLFLVLAKATDPTLALITKECEFYDNVFRAQLTSTDTASLSEGIYHIFFSLHTPDDLKHKKLYGSIYVRSSASG